MSAYGWIIDKDYIATLDAEPGTNCNAPGVIGPSDIPEVLRTRLENGEGVRFRMYDDDGERYYDGRLVLMDTALEVVRNRPAGEHFVPGTFLYESLPEEAFGPLDDFGRPNAGATEIKFFDSQNRLGIL